MTSQVTRYPGGPTPCALPSSLSQAACLDVDVDMTLDLGIETDSTAAPASKPDGGSSQADCRDPMTLRKGRPPPIAIVRRACVTASLGSTLCSATLTAQSPRSLDPSAIQNYPNSTQCHASSAQYHRPSGAQCQARSQTPTHVRELPSKTKRYLLGFYCRLVRYLLQMTAESPCSGDQGLICRPARSLDLIDLESCDNYIEPSVVFSAQHHKLLIRALYWRAVQYARMLRRGLLTLCWCL
ncbi:hypothetical protein B0H66DRAFT_528163 [Apodospora peruviana]|uniref:Uncharacterized protein n=1 Tax=Apodospora peruviana TaxID=516989 RepID=A0AAE0IT75_9PEZI|nr:hypothetical protein B0H66DRAFT_528163 [Apodospora peruviana]